MTRLITKTFYLSECYYLFNNNHRNEKMHQNPCWFVCVSLKWHQKSGREDLN